ncbi:MAG: hypothetical protein KAH54_12465 [Candidatus Sabulitectum sp.]|nr:hypothetical protein [Candidatus Sabulitectum sp.]
MSFLLIALLGITVTQPNILDQTDEEWTAPGYRVIEEVSINPLDYGEPISWGENCNGPTASIGCQAFFMPTEDGEKWRIVMLLKDKLVVLQEDEEPREIPLACSPTGIIYSRNGRFALVLGNCISGSRSAIYAIESEYVNIDTGEVRVFEAMQSTGWTGMQYVNDDGSIYRWDYTAVNLLEYYDPDLNLVFSREINIGWFTRYAHASGGSTILLAIPNLLTVYDKNGTLLWEKELEVDLPCDPLISADGSVVLLATSYGLECYEGFTGELLWEEYETGTLAPVPAVSGRAWAVLLRGRGLVSGSDAISRESIIDMRYPAETWGHGVPSAVADNGITLSRAGSLPPEYQNGNLTKMIYSSSEGVIIWISSLFSVASSPLNIAGSNNTEVELRLGSSIQLSGERFAYSDYSTVRIMRVEGGDE